MQLSYLSGFRASSKEASQEVTSTNVSLVENVTSLPKIGIDVNHADLNDVWTQGWLWKVGIK